MVNCVEGVLRFRMPLEEILYCGKCAAKFKSKSTRHSDLARHFRDHHQDVAVEALSFFCFCGSGLPTYALASSHHRSCNGVRPASHTAVLEGGEDGGVGTLILRWPPGLTDCPFCDWIARPGGQGKKSTSGAQDMKDHLYLIHKRHSEHKWRCSVCGIIDNASVMKCRHKHQDGSFNSQEGAAGPPNASISLAATPELSRLTDDSRSSGSHGPGGLGGASLVDGSHFQPGRPSGSNGPGGGRGGQGLAGQSTAGAESATGPMLDSSSAASPEQDPPPMMRALPPSPPIDRPTTPAEPQRHMAEAMEEPAGSRERPPTYRGPTATAPPASPLSPPGILDLSDPEWDSASSVLEAAREADERLEAHQLHFNKWRPILEQCASPAEFDDAVEALAREWHEKTAKEEDQPQHNRPARAAQASAEGGRRSRNQSRQQQRVRRSARDIPGKASRIQREFNRFPRRATRKVLGERSPPYSGTLADAENFLRGTYSQPRPHLDGVRRARQIYDGCGWRVPSDATMARMDSPPTAEEIVRKLRRAINTAPGSDRIEYNDIKQLDPHGRLLEVLYRTVWRLGIPSAWRTARTIFIYKKGDTADLSNFRPISLLSSLYKLLSGVLANRIVAAATDLGWVSPEQKGFLPGVHGIQEHTEMLLSAVAYAKRQKQDLSLVFLDLANAFGSLPHAYLGALFQSLPLPDNLKRLLADIYHDNNADFVVNRQVVSVALSSGVRQGDGLSAVVFILAAEPLIRLVKEQLATGFDLFGTTLRTLAYADDMALISGSRELLQRVIAGLSRLARELGLIFNPPKCASLTHMAGKVTAVAPLTINDRDIRELKEDEAEPYLGTPIGSRLCFRLPNKLPQHLAAVADSLLSPWQKLEVFRGFLLPALSHHFASGRVLKEDLYELDMKCRDFLAGAVASVPPSATTSFFYADRRAGGLGASNLLAEADIWTLARAVQLLCSSDGTVRKVAWGQLLLNIQRALRDDLPDPPPYAEYLSGSTTRGLHLRRDMFDVRYNNQGNNLWGRARKAAMRLTGLAAKHGLPPIRIEIDVAGDDSTSTNADDVSRPEEEEPSHLTPNLDLSHRRAPPTPPAPAAAALAPTATIRIVLPNPPPVPQTVEEDEHLNEDFISVLPCKAVRGMRTAVRSWFTKTFAATPCQGSVARALLLDKAKDTAVGLSTRTRMSFADWRYIFRARLGLLPVRGLPGLSLPDQGCRRCAECDLETTLHVLNGCRANRGLFVRRHDMVLDALVPLLLSAGHHPTVNRNTTEGQRPDILIAGNPPLVIDVAVPFDRVDNLQRAAESKAAKYSNIGRVFPLVVGSLGSWLPANDDIRQAFGIGGRRWNAFRRTARLLAIRGSTEIIKSHLLPRHRAE